MDALRLIALSALIGAVGLPLYVHLPSFAAADLGVGLASLGAILLGLRGIDMVQDPFLGWLIDRTPRAAGVIASLAALLIALGLLGVFYLRVETYQTALLIISAIVLFSGYSALYILLYKTSATLEMRDPARIRELGLLIGVIAGAALPLAMGNDYARYGMTLAITALVVALFVYPIWGREFHRYDPVSFQRLRNIGATRILSLVFLNSIPVAITATLFLFFVQARLGLAAYSGGLLVLFFSGALIGVILTSIVSPKLGRKLTLQSAMIGAVLVFVWAAVLPHGALISFGLISALSGVFLGAELYILPLAFSQLLARNNIELGSAFGIWTFLNKFGLALAAGIVLPILSWVGFSSGASNSPLQVLVLTLCYAVLPSIIKLGALYVTYKTPNEVLQ